MGRVPPEVLSHPLNLTWQAAFTWLSWAIVLVMIAIAIRLGRRHKTSFFLYAIVAAAIGAFAEPIYDVAFDLWFYDANLSGAPGSAWSHFSAFRIVQPNWTHSGYVILYAAAPLYAGKLLYDGRLSRLGLSGVWVLEIVSSCVFEVIGTGTDVYTYYGPYVLRIGNYPLVIGVLEGTQTLLFTVLAVQLWRRVGDGWELASLIAAFPVTMFGVNIGVGAPIVVALHLDAPYFSSSVVWVATFVTIGLCALAVQGAATFMPKALGEKEPDGHLFISKQVSVAVS
jgi:hypothetical protein